MAEPPKAQEAANVLKLDPNSGKLVLTDEARGIFIKRTKEALSTGDINLGFPCMPPIPVFDKAKDLDLADKEKYPDFHKFWIDGMYTSVARALNVQSQFQIPVFDPIALGLKLGLPAPLPDLNLVSVAASFAAPIPMALQLLKIKPLDFPNMIPKVTGLVIPKPPSIALDWQLPNISFAPFGALDIQLALATGLPSAFLGLVAGLAKPDFWLKFTIPGLFELSCQTMSKPFMSAYESSPSSSPPITAFAAAKAMGSVTADCAAFAGTSSVIGAGIVVDKEAESKGYKQKKQERSPDLVAEAALHNLLPFDPDEGSGAKWVFKDTNRKFWFGDPITVDYLYALADYMKSQSFEVPDYVLEIGNISGLDDDWINSEGSKIKGKGWRYCHSTETTNPRVRHGLYKSGPPITTTFSAHAGASFDMAYPMRDGNTRITGMNPNSRYLTREHAELETTFLSSGAVKKETLASSNKTRDANVYRPDAAGANKDGPLTEASDFNAKLHWVSPGWKADYYDREVIYELVKWSRKYFIDLAESGKVEISANDKVMPTPIQQRKPGSKINYRSILNSFSMGPCVRAKMVDWANKNRAKDPEKDAVLGLIAPQSAHEDHIHVRLTRSRLNPDKTAETGKNHYLLLVNTDAYYGNTKDLEKYPDRAIFAGHPVEERDIADPADPAKKLWVRI